MNTNEVKEYIDTIPPSHITAMLKSCPAFYKSDIKSVSEIESIRKRLLDFCSSLTVSSIEQLWRLFFKHMAESKLSELNRDIANKEEREEIKMEIESYLQTI